MACPPSDFVKRMEKEAFHPGRVRVAPTVTIAIQALGDIAILLWGDSHGKSGGYKPPQFDQFVRVRLEGMRAMLALYTDPRSATYEQWGKSAFNAAIGMGRGSVHCARVLAQLCHAYIEDRKILPINLYGAWQVSMLADEDLAEDVQLYLQQLGKFITADKLMEYLH